MTLEMILNTGLCFICGIPLFFLALLTTKQVAEILGISQSGVLKEINRGNLPAEKIGPMWVIRSNKLKQYQKTRRGPGRPPEKGK
jgi:excisionase family DNA binding protein